MACEGLVLIPHKLYGSCFLDRVPENDGLIPSITEALLLDIRSEQESSVLVLIHIRVHGSENLRLDILSQRDWNFKTAEAACERFEQITRCLWETVRHFKSKEYTRPVCVNKRFAGRNMDCNRPSRVVGHSLVRDIQRCDIANGLVLE